MLRREYKAIKRRLMRRREAAGKEGKWASGSCPYGCKRVRIENGMGRTLEVVPDEAETVKLIFQMYTKGELLPDGTRRNLGAYPICLTLERLNIPAPGGGREWRARTISLILRNPAYVGKARWNRSKTKRRAENGRVTPERHISDPDSLIPADGPHEAIIAPDTFRRAADKLAQHGLAPVHPNGELKTFFPALPFVGNAGGHWHCGRTQKAMQC